MKLCAVALDYDGTIAIRTCFVFTCNGHEFGSCARTWKEFVTLQARLPAAALEGHARRGDFSLWIRNVFGDEPLAVQIRQVERDFRQGRIANLSITYRTDPSALRNEELSCEDCKVIPVRNSMMQPWITHGPTQRARRRAPSCTSPRITTLKRGTISLRSGQSCGARTDELQESTSESA